MDATQIGILIGSVCGALGALGGGFSTWGINAYLKYRADQREDRKQQNEREDAEDEKEDKTLRFIIGRQDGELTSLRSELREMQVAHRSELTAIHSQHNECEKRHAELATELRIFKEQMHSRVEQACEETKSAIRKGVHDIRDTVNAAALKEQVEKAQGQ